MAPPVPWHTPEDRCGFRLLCGFVIRLFMLPTYLNALFCYKILPVPPSGIILPLTWTGRKKKKAFLLLSISSVFIIFSAVTPISQAYLF